MKKSILLFVFFFITNFTFSQVTIIFYNLEYNDATDLFDCKLYVEDGTAISAAERLLIDAQFSVIVASGTTIAVADNSLPIYNNETYSGTDPVTWLIDNIEVNPSELPGYDIIGIVPDFSGQPAHFNDLSCCNTHTLFSLSADGIDICDLSIRLFNNDVDPTTLASGLDFSNSMMIGNTNEIYAGNLNNESNWGAVDITIPDGVICEGECITLVPTFNCTFPGLTYEWSTGEVTETITVCPEVSQNYYMNLSGPFGGGYEIEVNVKVDNGISTGGVTELCVGVPVSYSPEIGIWTSSDENIVTVTNAGFVSPISPGSATISHTTELGNCLDEVVVTVLSPELPTIIGADKICEDATTQLSPSIGVTWTSGNPAVATVDNSGLVTGVGFGATVFIYTTTQGCISEQSPAVNVMVIPDPEITGLDAICANETTTLTPNAGVTWESLDISVATIDNSGNVTAVSEGSARFFFTDMSNGCTSEESEPVTVFPSPMVQLSRDSICFGDSILATTNSSGGMWKFTSIAGVVDAASIDTLTGIITTLGPGVSNIQYENEMGCISEEKLLTVFPALFPQVSNNSPVCIGQTLFLLASAFSPLISYEYEWSGPNGFSSNEKNITIPDAGLENNGIYTLIAYANGCASETLTVPIIVEDCDPCEEADASDDWIKIPASDDNFSSVRTFQIGTSLVTGRELEDFIYYNSDQEEIRLIKNTGDTYFEEEVILFDLPDLGWEVKIDIVDIDGDGLNDIITYQTEFTGAYDIKGLTINLYKNLDNYSFENRLLITKNIGTSSSLFPIEYFDLDNQGFLDIIPNFSSVIFTDNWVENSVQMPAFSTTILVEDFNQDNLLDILRSDAQLMVNNGDRTFSISPTNGDELSSKGLYNKENGVFTDGYITYEITNETSPTITLCSDPAISFGQDYFYANINSSTNVNGIITTIDGFYVFETPITCENSFQFETNLNFVPSKEGKIDLTNNGYSDFITVEDNQIFAWINPNEQPKLKGTAFIDNNGDGILNENDSPLRNVLISIDPGNLSILTDDFGNYQFSAPEGNYTLTAIVNEGFWIMDELSIENVTIDEPCNLGFDFGFVPDPSAIPMVNLSMVNTIARCDFETRFTITVENIGTEPLQSQLQFEFDDKTTLFDVEFSGYTTAGNKVIADIGPLLPFQPQKYNIKVKMPSGSSVLPMLDFNASVLTELGEVISEYGYTEQLRCSYDPNDKREFPDREGDENLTLMDEDIEYTIRFQNNGNDTAYSVTIVDPLSSHIDPSSIRVVGASHEVVTCIEGTDLIFLFEDIYLVDSMTNYPLSQGYVTFKCNAKEGQAEFTPVNNSADIIFDTNLPIITNQTLNTLVSELCTDKSATIDKNICDGEDYLGYTESGIYTEYFELLYGCDSIVTINLTVQGITYSQQNLEVCEGLSITLGEEEYIIDADITIIDTILNDQGCITNVLKYEVVVVPDLIEIEKIEICAGETGLILPDFNGTWSVDDESVINIDDQGTITAANSGVATIQYLDHDSGCLDEIEVEVYPIPTVINEGSDQICVNETTLFTSDFEGTWTSSDPALATISPDGNVSGLEAGSVTFTFTSSTTGCSVSSDILILPLTDSNCLVSTDEILPDAVHLYPNPANESIFIVTNEAWSAIRIINAQGQLVMKNIEGFKAWKKININELSKGLYFVILEKESQVIVKKFIVN